MIYFYHGDFKFKFAFLQNEEKYVLVHEGISVHLPSFKHVVEEIPVSSWPSLQDKVQLLP